MHSKATTLSWFAALVLAACAANPPVVRAPAPPSAPAPPLSAEASKAVVSTAVSLVGTPYATGGASPASGFDCSGLVAYVYAHALQVMLPRSTFALARMGDPIPTEALQPGDLVFYNTLHRQYSHVGIYLGKARFVHAPASGGAVRIEDMHVSYWTSRYDGARRIAFFRAADARE